MFFRFKIFDQKFKSVSYYPQHPKNILLIDMIYVTIKYEYFYKIVTIVLMPRYLCHTNMSWHFDFLYELDKIHLEKIIYKSIDFVVVFTS